MSDYHGIYLLWLGGVIVTLVGFLIWAEWDERR